MGSDEKIGGIDLIHVIVHDSASRVRVDGLHGINFVVPENDTHDFFGISKENVHRVALDAERAGARTEVVADIERADEFVQERALSEVLADAKFNDVFVEGGRVSHTVNTRNGRHDNHVLSSREQRGGGSKAKAVDVFVDGKVFFDVGVGRSDVSLRLIVVIVGDIILHRILREETFELLVELCRKGFVVAQHERWFPYFFDDPCQRERLSGAGDAEQNLCGQPALHALCKVVNCFRLVAGRRKLGKELERLHGEFTENESPPRK